jgi:hypothetical protein
MNADQHPALSYEPADLPSLTLVLPGGLEHDQTLSGLIQAITQARGGLAARIRQFRQLADGYAARGDPLRQALCRGQALGGEHAGIAIDEAIIEIFDLWPQYEAQLQRQAEDPRPAPDGPQVAHDRRRAPHQPDERPQRTRCPDQPGSTRCHHGACRNPTGG